MWKVLAEMEAGDLIVATRNDFTTVRKMHTFEWGSDYIAIKPGCYGMFLKKFPTQSRPDGFLVYVISEARIAVGIPTRWKFVRSLHK